MIEIKEITPIKLSGLTSLKVSFPYSKEVVEIVKTFTPAVWHKKKLFREVSTCYLAKLVDALVLHDDIELKLLDTEKKVIQKNSLTESELASFRVKPFSHQVDSINFGLNHDKWLLLDGMGLGKSLQAMYLAETLYSRGEIEHCMIICGVDSLRTNWKSEIKRFSKLDCLVLGEYQTKLGKSRYRTIEERAKQLQEPIKEFFIIVNVATIRDDRIIKAFEKSKNKIDMIVVDECHRVSNKSSSQGSNLLKLDTKYKLAMTGSLITNNPESCYLPLVWTENDHSTLTNFRGQYCNYGGFGGIEVVGYKNLDLLREELESCSLRRTFDEVRSDMPKKTIDFEIVEMSEEHQKFYEAIKEGIKEEADKITLTTGNLLALTTRLRQATSSPSTLTSNPIKSSKVERAVEIIEDVLSRGEKIVVFSTFLDPCKILEERLSRFHPLLATGNIDDDLAQRNIDTFRNSKDFNLLIGTHGKLGTGYSMPECHYSLMIDFPWTYYAFSQSCDRIYRITSQDPVYIKALVCADTIDERVRNIVENKKELQDYLVDGKENSISDSLKSEMIDILRTL